MSTLYGYNTLGYGTSKYQMGLDSSIITEPKKEPGFFTGIWEGVSDVPGALWYSTKGAGAGLLGSIMRSEPNEDETGFTLEKALSEEDILKADDIKEEAGEYFEESAKESRKIVRNDYTPSAEKTGLAGQIIYGFSVMAGKQIGYSLITGGNPMAGAALTGLDYGVNEAGNLRDKGVDKETAFKAGATTAALTGVGLAIPAAAPAGKLNPNRWTSAAWMAGANVAADSGEKALINYILNNADYKEIASEYDAFDPVGNSVSGILGGALGAIFFKKSRVLPRRTTDAVATEAESVPTAPLELDTETLQSLQNRDRSTTSSVVQMRSIAANPDYDRLRTSPILTEGAPVITYADDIPTLNLGFEDTATAADGTKYQVRYAVVEADSVLTSNDINGSKNAAYTDPDIQGARAIAGNGRIAGLKEAYAQGTADKYKADLMNDQRRTGIYSDVINGMEKPILVRILDPKDVTKNLADKSNTSGVSRMSIRERAKNDAARIDLAKLKFDEDGNITDDTLISFIQQLPAEERAELLLKDNKPNKMVRDRVEAAIFAKAYDNDTLISQVAEVDKPEARLVLKALMKLAPKVAQLAGTDFDFAPSLIRAAAKIMGGYKRGFKIKEIAAQKEFDEDPIADAIVELFAKDARTSRHVVETLSDVIDSVRSSTESGGDLFGSASITRDDVLNVLRSKMNDRYSVPPESVVDAARTKQVANTINEDQLVSSKGGDMNESIANEQKATAQVDNGERVSVKESAVDQERVEAEKRAVVDAIHSVQEEAKGDPLEVLAQIKPEDVQGITIRRGWYRKTNKDKAMAAELGTPFGLVKVWLKHIKEENRLELKVTDDDLRQIPLILRNRNPIPKVSPNQQSREWRINHNGRELVLVDTPVKGSTDRTMLTFYVQNPATRGSGRAKNAPLSELRDGASVPEAVNPNTEITRAPSNVSSRASGPHNGGELTTRGSEITGNPAGESAYPPADTTARLPLLSSRPSGSPNGEGVTTQSPSRSNLPDQTLEGQLIESLPETIREPIKRVMDLFTGGEEEAPIPTERVAREFSTDAMFQKAIMEHPEMDLTLPLEGDEVRKVSVREYLEEQDLLAKDLEKDGKVQGEAMMCVLQNKGI